MAENQKIQQIDCTKVPEPTLRRLPWYLSNVKLLKQRGERFVSSTQISKEINIDASQIAKDLSYVNISGRTRVGYEVDALIEVLEHFLGFTEIHKAFLFGVGSLGGALLQDSGLKHFGLEIVAAFDVDPTLVGTNLNGIPIYHSDDFLKKMEEYDVQIGVLSILFGSICFPWGESSTSIHTFLYKILLMPIFGETGGSLAYALLFVGINWCIGYQLYKRKIYIKI